MCQKKKRLLLCSTVPHKVRHRSSENLDRENLDRENLETGKYSACMIYIVDTLSWCVARCFSVQLYRCYPNLLRLSTTTAAPSWCRSGIFCRSSKQTSKETWSWAHKSTEAEWDRSLNSSFFTLQSLSIYRNLTSSSPRSSRPKPDKASKPKAQNHHLGFLTPA